MGREAVESLRFDVDPDTSGLWTQVKGDVHRRLRSAPSNPDALRFVARVYLDLTRRDPQTLGRIITALQLEDKGYQI